MGRSRHRLRSKAAERRLGALLLACALLAGCEEGASTRELFVTQAIPSADGTWIWVGQIDQFGAGAPADGGVDVGIDVGVDAGMAVTYGGDAWLARVAEDRTTRWQLAVGAAGSFETAEWVLELSDTRIAVVGSAMGDVDGDAWLLFLEARGAIARDRRFGGPGDQRFVSATLLSNGDVVAIGLTTATDGTPPAMLMARFTAQGEIVWQRRAAMTDASRVVPIQVLLRDDGRLLFLGAVDVGSVGRGLEVWAAATDLDGNLEWQRTLGTTSDDVPAHAVFGTDRSLIFAARVAPVLDPTSSDPVTGDVWVVKVDAGGSVAWQRYIERVGSDEIPRRVVLREDGRVNVVASADGFGSRVPGDTDVWIVELSAEGSVERQRIVASLSPDRPVNAIEVDAQTLTIAGVMDERPITWTITDGGELIEGCGNVADTDARVVDTSVQVGDGLATWETPTFTAVDGASSDARPPPLQPLECRVAL